MDKELPAQLSQAFESGNFERAGLLITDYGRAIREELAGADTAVAREVLVNDALAFLRERLRLARVLRSHLSSQLQLATMACQYQESNRQPATWQLEG